MAHTSEHKRAQRAQDFRTTWWPLICYLGTLVFVLFGPWGLLTNYLVAGAAWGMFHQLLVFTRVAAGHFRF